MKSSDTVLAYDLLKAIHEDPEATTGALAEAAWTDIDTVLAATQRWLATGVLYSQDGNLYLTEDGRRELGLYVRPVQAVA